LPMLGHIAMEVTSVHMGEFAPALDHFEKALALYDHEHHRESAFLYSQNSGVAMQGHSAWALWFLGQVDQSLERMREALSFARELKEPHGLAHALYFAAILHYLRREDQLAQEYADEAIAVSIKHGLLLYQAMATIVRGWALFVQGSEQEGIAQIRDGLAGHEATGTRVARPHFLAMLAQSLGRTGQIEEGLELWEEALEIAQRGDACYLAELYRAKGELLFLRATGESLASVNRPLADPSVIAAVAACFDESIKTAKRQQAKSWELRSVVSLARLYRLQGEKSKARQLLAEIYSSFTEGFDTLPLREAKELLAELSLIK